MTNLALVKENTEAAPLFKKCGCGTCAQKNPQPLENFYKNKSHKYGVSHRCKTCQKQATKKSDRKHRIKRNEKTRLLQKKLKLENPEKAWAKRRNQRLKAQYGITLNRYYEMLIEQNNRCAICLTHELELKKCGNLKYVTGLVVDHDHKTGNVRKLLCSACNQMLGYSRENIKSLQGAIEYLRSFDATC